MRDDEIAYVQRKVKSELIPELIKLIPRFLRPLLRKVFPKMDDKILNFILRLVDVLLADRLIK